MARWTYLALGSLVVLCALGQLALLACGPRASRGFPGDDASIGGPGGGSIEGSGASMGSTTSGAGNGSGAPGSGDPGTSGSSSAGSGPSSGSVAPDDSGYVVRNCAATPCDLRSNTCCLPEAGIDASYCVKGANYNCGPDIITYHCLGAVDCPVSGNICCGVYDLDAALASTSCLASCSATGFQFCMVDGECAKGVKCTSQTCLGVGPLYFCGLHSESPYNCTSP